LSEDKSKKKKKNTINQVNQREKDIFIKRNEKQKSIATVTIKAMINEGKAVENAKFTGARTEQHTHIIK
jgi:hypothetical protein